MLAGMTTWKAFFILPSHRHLTDLLSLMALCGTASGATGLSRSTSCTRELRTGSLCLSLYFGYRPSSTVHSSSYTLVCTWRLKDRGKRRSDCPSECYFGVLWENVETYLWPVQEESHSPIQPGCSGLCPSNEKVHSGHVNVNIWQKLGRPKKFIIKRRIYRTVKVDLSVHVQFYMFKSCINSWLTY